MNLPRLFVPSSDPAVALTARASELVRVVGVFGVENRSGPMEMIAGTTIQGDLVAIPADERTSLSPPLQAALAHHEIASQSGHPVFLAEEIFLFRVELLEEAPDAPGLNDPVYLYGSLSGPFPETPATCSVKGQLTVSRSDVLGGFRLGSRWPFHAKRTEREAFRCFFGMLPGDRAEAIALGRGVVLAYPLALEAVLESPGNELWIAQILYDLLESLQEELRASHARSPFAKATIPVPSRAAFIRDLESEGFEIDGDVAVREKRDGGLVSRVFRGRERVVIPKEASVEELLALTELALADLGDPAGVGAALARVVDADAGARRAAISRFAAVAAPRTVEVHARAGAPPIAVTSDRPANERVAKRASRDEWIRDFVDKHRVHGRPEPKLSSPTRAAAPPTPNSWMSDFGGTAALPTQREAATPKPSPDAENEGDEKRKPDWMKDFE